MFSSNIVGQILQGHYYITEKLGEGGIGETYLAQDRSKFNQICVVKKLLPQKNQTILQWVQNAFENEARTLSKLGNHPQIPTLLGYFFDSQNNDFYLVQEYIEGQDLRHTMYQKQWNQDEVKTLLNNILEVLDFIHQNQVIHRDLKPENLIIRQSDQKIVIIDFGAVKEISTKVYSTQGHVVSTLAIGTPGYTPMEQLNKNPKLCSDIYAVGMMGIELLTGVYPEQIPQDQNTLEFSWHHLVKTQVSPDFLQILDKMTRYRPHQRYQSASEAKAALNNNNNIGVKGGTSTGLTNMEYADFGMRLVAYIIDVTIVFTCAVFWDLMSSNSKESSGFWGRILATYIIFGFIYAPIMESSALQGTLGKKLLGIKVTDLNGNQLSFEQATKRHSSKFLSYLTIFIGFFMAGFTEKKQCIHDMISKSLVIRR